MSKRHVCVSISVDWMLSSINKCYLLSFSNYEEYFLHAQRIRRLISEDFRQVFQSGVDMLLVPVVLWDAPTYGEYQKDDNRTQCGKQDVFTQPTNLAGQWPIITLTLQSPFCVYGCAGSQLMREYITFGWDLAQPQIENWSLYWSQNAPGELCQLILVLPCHQQQLYWLCKINFYSMRKDLYYIHHLSAQKWFKMQIYFHSLNK